MAWTYGELRQRGVTEGQIRWLTEERRLDRPFDAVYLPSGADERAKLRALFRRLPAEAALTRGSAARLHGFGDFVAPTAAVEIALPAGMVRPRIRGVRVHQTALRIEPLTVDGIPCVPPARCAVELARTARRLDALPPLDGALRVGCTPDELLAEVSAHTGLPGVRQARNLIPLANPGAQCRQESQLRLVIIDGRLPCPETQVAIDDEGGWTRYYLDVGWRERKVGAEYDGVSHLDRDRARRDRERHNWLAARGWRMRYFTDVDLYRRPGHLVAVLRSVLRP
jgi:very-short-patch-repair endonuclease